MNFGVVTFLRKFNFNHSSYFVQSFDNISICRYFSFKIFDDNPSSNQIHLPKPQWQLRVDKESFLLSQRLTFLKDEYLQTDRQPVVCLCNRVTKHTESVPSWCRSSWLLEIDREKEINTQLYKFVKYTNNCYLSLKTPLPFQYFWCKEQA